MKAQRILCNQTDCIHNTSGFIQSYNLRHSNHSMFDYYCNEPNGVVISTKKGCQTKEIKTK